MTDTPQAATPLSEVLERHGPRLAPPSRPEPPAVDEAQAIRALAALAQPMRLRVFRVLVGAGPAGLTPGVLAVTLGLPPSSLSFHLKELTHAGLITSERAGRHIVYRTQIEAMNALLGYLTEHCCQGQPCGLLAPADVAAFPSCTTC